MAHGIFAKLTKYATSNKVRSQEAKAVLPEICRKAFAIALLFRSTKTEYVWLQRPSRHEHVPETEWEPVGSVQYPDIATAKGDFKIVFGAVAKGAGQTGKFQDEPYFLRKDEVLLGPFKDLADSVGTTVSGEKVKGHSRWLW